MLAEECRYGYVLFSTWTETGLPCGRRAVIPGISRTETLAGRRFGTGGPGEKRSVFRVLGRNPGRLRAGLCGWVASGFRRGLRCLGGVVQSGVLFGTLIVIRRGIFCRIGISDGFMAGAFGVLVFVVVVVGFVREVGGPDHSDGLVHLFDEAEALADGGARLFA